MKATMIEVPAATKMQKKQEIPYRQELIRKGIHLVSLSIPIVYAFIPRESALWILVPLTIIALVIDVLMHISPLVRKLMIGAFGHIMRTHELDQKRILLTGATYVLLSASLVVFFFPKIIAVTAFTIMIVSDLCAALIGRKFGRHRFFDKSVEGTLAFIVSAIGVVAIIGFNTQAPKEFFIAGFFGAVVGGVVEAASKQLRFDDNLSIPLSIGILMWALGYFFEQNFHQSFLHLMN